MEIIPAVKEEVMSPGMSPVLALLSGEVILMRVSSGGCTVAATNYRVFMSWAEERRWMCVQLESIESVEQKGSRLVVVCKNGRIIGFPLPDSSETLLWATSLREIIPTSSSLTFKYAFVFYKSVMGRSVMSSGSSASSSEEELAACSLGERLKLCHGPKEWEGGDNSCFKDLERLDFTSDTNWRLSEMNQAFRLCPSYPSVLCVPHTVSDSQLKEYADCRTLSRLPSVVWRDQCSGAVLLRSSQPLIGVGGLIWWTKNDAPLVSAVLSAACAGGLGCRKKLVIVDARSQIAARANQAANGGGVESPASYPNCEVVFMSLPNIHYVRSSFESLRKLMAAPRSDNTSWLSSVEKTEWLQTIGTLLSSARYIAMAMTSQGSSILVHCSDGWDRTPQLVALSMILMDPYYRTIQGFCVLIDVQWVQYGHKFGDRCGMEGALKCGGEISPVFLQWLDCVHQMVQQQPTEFEFNTALLLCIGQHAYSALFGTFLGNSSKEREEEGIKDGTFSLWNYLHTNPGLYTNLLYKGNSTKPGGRTQVLPVAESLRNLRLWEELFYSDMNVISSSNEETCQSAPYCSEKNVSLSPELSKTSHSNGNSPPEEPALNGFHGNGGGHRQSLGTQTACNGVSMDGRSGDAAPVNGYIPHYSGCHGDIPHYSGDSTPSITSGSISSTGNIANGARSQGDTNGNGCHVDGELEVSSNSDKLEVYSLDNTLLLNPNGAKSECSCHGDVSNHSQSGEGVTVATDEDSEVLIGYEEDDGGSSSMSGRSAASLRASPEAENHFSTGAHTTSGELILANSIPPSGELMLANNIPVDSSIGAHTTVDELTSAVAGALDSRHMSESAVPYSHGVACDPSPSVLLEGDGNISICASPLSPAFSPSGNSIDQSAQSSLYDGSHTGSTPIHQSSGNDETSCGDGCRSSSVEGEQLAPSSYLVAGSSDCEDKCSHNDSLHSDHKDSNGTSSLEGDHNDCGSGMSRSALDLPVSSATGSLHVSGSNSLSSRGVVSPLSVHNSVGEEKTEVVFSASCHTQSSTLPPSSAVAADLTSVVSAATVGSSLERSPRPLRKSISTNSLNRTGSQGLFSPPDQGEPSSISSGSDSQCVHSQSRARLQRSSSGGRSPCRSASSAGPGGPTVANVEGTSDSDLLRWPGEASKPCTEEAVLEVPWMIGDDGLVLAYERWDWRNSGVIRALSQRSKEAELEISQLLDHVREMEKERESLFGALRERKMADRQTGSAALEGGLKSQVYVSTTSPLS